MTAGALRAAPTIAPHPALAPSPQPRPAPTARALPPALVEQGGQNWTPIGGQICTPIDTIRCDRHEGRRDIDPDVELHPARRRGNGVGKPASVGVDMPLVASGFQLSRSRRAVDAGGQVRIAFYS